MVLPGESQMAPVSCGAELLQGEGNQDNRTIALGQTFSLGLAGSC